MNTQRARLRLGSVIGLLAVVLPALHCCAGPSEEALQAWQDQRFGMFIHWGPVSLKGTEIGWSRGKQVPCAEYDQLLSSSVEPPTPYGPVPTERQLRWHEMEFYGFIHFTVNTFTDKEWGYGDESPETFNPTDFSAQQIARTAKKGGMKGLILTAKHHDGFCLWPSKYTEHSVRNSPWCNGKGDVVREMSEACRQEGLKFGVYLSPWDRNHARYGFPEYLSYYRNQLRELLTNYGDLFTVWFDGANGGDGYYGGAREMRRIDNRSYYDWTNTWQIVRQLMPNAALFSDVGRISAGWVTNTALPASPAGPPSMWETTYPATARRI